MQAQPEKFDVAIIGLGPAGATTARQLDPRLRVIAIDRKSPTDATAFTKPCGGLLAPDAQKALSKFNLTLPKDILVDPQIFAVRTLDLEHDITRCYQRFYMNLDHRKFDEWLISLIPDTVEIATSARCTSLERTATGDGFRVAFTDGKTERIITSKHVIGADGSDSFVRKTLFPQRKIRRLTSIQQWFAEEHATPFYSCVFDSSITPSYCWSISKDGYFILGGAFPVKNSRVHFERLKAKLVARGFRLGKPVKTEACMVSIPRSPRDFCVGASGALLVGEAAGFISPSSLEGISYALDSGVAAAIALNATLDGAGAGANVNVIYARKTAPIRRKLMMKHIKSQFMYRPLLRKLVMKSGLDAIEVEE